MDRTAAAKIRPSIRCLIAGAAALYALAAAWPALAQTAGTAGPISLGELFTGPGSVELKDDAARKLHEAAVGAINPRADCPQQANIKVIVKRGDPLFQQALAAARRDALDGALKNQGFPDSRYESTYDWQGSANDVQVSYGRMRDRQPPSLDTTWDPPPNSTKVQAGDRITVTMVARDDSHRAQSGIQRIQLIARTAGGDEPVGSQDYPLVPRPNCEGTPEARTLVLTYRVPSDPPPIVRLVAVTEDHVGLSDHDLGEFPTGDWTGTFTYEGVSVAAVKSRASADIVLNHDGKGNLRGTMVGQHQVPAGTSNNCSWMPSQPNRFRVSLVGSYTEGRSFKVFIDEVVEDTGIKYMLQCSGIPIPVALDRAFDPYTWGYKAFLGTPSPLGEGEVTADGVRQYKLDSAPGPAWTVTLRPARN